LGHADLNESRSFALPLWLFGSGLLGLIGVARKKATKQTYKSAPVVGGLAGGLFHLSTVLAEAFEG
jgi:hypothetical protein